jgi:arylsulfatase A-like enzyme
MTLAGPAGDVACLPWETKLPLPLPAWTSGGDASRLLLLVPPDRRGSVPPLKLRFTPDRSRLTALEQLPGSAAEALSARPERGFEHRRSLILPAGAELRIPSSLALPERAHLMFGVTLDRLGRSPNTGLLRLEIALLPTGGGEERVILEQPVLPAGGFRPIDVDLSPHLGRAWDLRIRAVRDPTRPSSPLDVLALSEPAVRVPQEEMSLRARLRKRPSVLLIVVDCLRADALGGDRNVSPFLDGLAARGLRYESAWSTASWTVPAVASLLTGLQPARHGATRSGLQALPPGLPLLAERLRAEGWRSFAAVANSMEIGEARGFGVGFDRFWGKQSAIAGEAVDAYIAWLSDLDPAEPTFAWLHLFDPHQPYLAPEPDRGRFMERGDRPVSREDTLRHLTRAALGEFHPEQPDDADVLRRLRSQYDGEVRYTDRELERLFQTLDALDRERDLLVLVTADHGESFGEKGLLGHGLHVWRAETRVPLLVAGPEVPASDVPEPVSAASLTPSILDYLGLLPEAGQAPVLDFKRGGRSREEGPLPGGWVPSETRAFPFPAQGWTRGVMALRNTEQACIHQPDKGTYLLGPVGDASEGSWRTLPVSEDPTGCVSAARTLWETEGVPGIRYTPIDPLRSAQLRALGYLVPDDW